MANEIDPLADEEPVRHLAGATRGRLLIVCLALFLPLTLLWLGAGQLYHPLLEAIYQGKAPPPFDGLMGGRQYVSIRYYLTLVDFMVFRLWLLATFAAVFLALDHISKGKLIRYVWRTLGFLEKRPRVLGWAVAAGFTPLFLVVAYWGLRAFANSADELVYLFQAETYAAGRLWVEPHSLQPSFHIVHTGVYEGKWFGMYPPGWPLLLATAGAMGLPSTAVNPLLGGLFLWVLFAFARRYYGVRVAVVTVLTVGSSAFFILNAGSFFPHVACGLLVLGFVWYGTRYLENDRARDAFLAGVCMGAAFLVRSYTAPLCGLSWGVYVLWQKRARGWAGLISAGLGAAPFLGLFLLNNHLIAGSPFISLPTLVEDDRLGFVNGHTPLKALATATLQSINFVLWSSPVVLPFYLVGLVALLKKKQLAFHDWIPLVIVAGFLFFYSDGGNRYGPRYYFEGYAFAVLLPAVYLFCGRKNGWGHPWMRYLFMVGMLAASWVFPWTLAHENRIIDHRRDLYRLVREQGLRQAVVLIGASTSPLRPMPPGDLTRNGIFLDRDVLYVRDLGPDQQRQLRAYYPDRKFYRYTRPKDEVGGRLAEIIAEP